MSAGPTSPAARLRGTAAGALTAALAVAAHSSAGGMLPSGATAVLLALSAVTLGALVTTLRRAADARVLLALLTVGQVVSHEVLGAAGHAHPSASGTPGIAMMAAHVVAVVVGAVLIEAGGRLCSVLSHALRVARPPTRRPVATMSTTVVGSADQPLRSALSLAASVSHRGPPVGFAH